MELSIVEIVGPTDVTLILAGDIDMATVPRFMAATHRALAAPIDRLILDLRGVRFCDSMGLNTLVKLRREAASAEVKVEISGLSNVMSRLLEITRPNELFPIVDHR